MRRIKVLGLLSFYAFCAQAQGVDVTLHREKNKIYSVNGQFSVTASTAVVWNVLTDYEAIPSFVRTMKRSQIRDARPGGTIILEQEAVGGLFLVSKRVRILLQVRRSLNRLEFVDIGLADFRSYEGSWDVQSSSSGALVRYVLKADPRVPAPGFILKGALRRSAADLLEQVHDEILRRAARVENGRAAARSGKMRP